MIEKNQPEQEFCIKCIICNLGAMAPLQEIAAVLQVVKLGRAGRGELIAALEKAEAAATEARDCLIKHLGMSYRGVGKPVELEANPTGE